MMISKGDWSKVEKLIENYEKKGKKIIESQVLTSCQVENSREEEN